MSGQVKSFPKKVYLSARGGRWTVMCGYSVEFAKLFRQDGAMTDRPRQDWPVVRNAIIQRMADLRLSATDLARASGLSEKHVRRLINGDDEAAPRNQTLWALCDGLGWSQDSIDRILHGDEPLEADPDESGEVTRLQQLDGRVEEIEALATGGLEELRNQANELLKFYRRMERLEDTLRSVEADRQSGLAEARSTFAELRERLASVESELQGLRQAERQSNGESP
jgi:transcriptional regulator with XRE-family HTH domain